MPFLKAGFNGRNTITGVRAYTRHVAGERYAFAQLRRFESGDYFWYGQRPDGSGFLAWGEQTVIGTHAAFAHLAEVVEGHPQSSLSEKPGAMPERVEFTIIGEPASKANSRELVMRGPKNARRPMFIKSEKALGYERDSLLQIPPRARVRYEGPVRVTLRIFYATERPDLDESLILDILQDRYIAAEEKGGERKLVQKGVYRNDRQVREKHVYHGIDRNNPHTDVIVEPLVVQAELLDTRPVVDARRAEVAPRMATVPHRPPAFDEAR